MQDERRKIHDMLADGRLTPAEAESQLAALARSAEQPVIDVGDGTQPPAPPPKRWQRFKARYWKEEYFPTYAMLAPLMLIMIGSAVLIAVGVTFGLAAVVLALPAVAIQLIWNTFFIPTAASRPISLVEAYGIAFILVVLIQGVKWTRWRR
ncbi:MAG: hypothetical protein H7338_05255 [Candidatus Sericytochromatia bacterium]|nr:hypothetical protein [Candidatus Sericytochromatia bacterium]